MSLHDRQAISSSCVNSCRGTYNPSVDIQRYCEGCCMWYHVACLSAAHASPSLIRLGLDDISGRSPLDLMTIAMYPIERGCAIGAVGNGRIQLRARRLLREGQNHAIKDWERIIGPRYIAAILKQEPVYFRCSKCD